MNHDQLQNQPTLYVCDTEECSQILNKELIYRTKEEMQILINFMSQIDFFKLAQIPTNTFNDYIIQICMHMKLQKYKKGQSVYDFGDQDSNFYLILKGNFVQYIPVNLDQIDQNIENEFIELLQIYKNKKDKYFNSDGNIIFQPFSVHSELEIFGESMINNMHLNRSEMVLSCQDHSQLGVISLKKYIEIIQNCWLGIKFDFDTIDSFLEQKFDSNSLLKMFKFQQEAKYQCGQFIYKEGDIPIFIYLIKQGEIHLCKKISIIENNQQNIKQNYITTLYQGMLFGEKEVVDDKNRQYTAIAASECVIYVILAEKFKLISQQQKKSQLNKQINLINQKTPIYIMGGKKFKQKKNSNYKHQQNLITFQQYDYYKNQNQKYTQTYEESIPPKLTLKTFVPLNKYQNQSNYEMENTLYSDSNYKNENNLQMINRNNNNNQQTINDLYTTQQLNSTFFRQQRSQSQLIQNSNQKEI